MSLRLFAYQYYLQLLSNLLKFCFVEIQRERLKIFSSYDRSQKLIIVFASPHQFFPTIFPLKLLNFF